jgi:hypothetical protein
LRISSIGWKVVFTRKALNIVAIPFKPLPARAWPTGCIHELHVLKLRISSIGWKVVFTPKALNIVAQGQRR